MQQLTKLKLEHSTKKIIAFIPALTWVGIIVYMSLLPSDELPIDVLVVSDKIIHASIYFGLTFLFLSAFIFNYNSFSNDVLKRSFWMSFSISLIIGIMIEIAQEKMNIGRSGDWKDVIANITGSVIVYPFMKRVLNLSVLKKILG